MSKMATQVTTFINSNLIGGNVTDEETNKQVPNQNKEVRLVL